MSSNTSAATSASITRSFDPCRVAAGFEIKEKSFKHEVKADVSTIRQGLTKYLDDFVAGGSSFANKTRPLDMKDLKVIAFIQDDNTGKVLQAVELPLDDHASATLETTRK